MIDFLKMFTSLFIRFMNEAELMIYVVACIVLGCVIRAVIQLLRAV